PARSCRATGRRRAPAGRPRWSLVLVGELPAPLVGGQCVGALLELAGQHLVERVEGQADAMVGDPVLLVVVRADLVGPATALRLAAAGRRQLLLLALALDLVEATAQDAHRLVLVLQLTLLVLAGDDETGRVVGDAHRGVGGVEGLPARGAGAVDVDGEVVGVDVDVDILRLRQHGDGRRARVHPALALRGGDALHAVRTGLVLEPAPRVVALHHE